MFCSATTPLFRAAGAFGLLPYGHPEKHPDEVSCKASTDRARAQAAADHGPWVKARSSQIGRREVAGADRSSWQVDPEQNEASLKAGNCCGQQSATLSASTANGEQMTSRSPEVRSIEGWGLQDDPDARFSRCVNHQAPGDRLPGSLVVQGSVDDQRESSLDFYD